MLKNTSKPSGLKAAHGFQLMMLWKSNKPRKKCVFRAKSQLENYFCLILKNRSWLAMKPNNCNPLGFCVNLLHSLAPSLSLLTSAQIFHFDLKKFLATIMLTLVSMFYVQLIVSSSSRLSLCCCRSSLPFLFLLFGDKLHKNLYLFCLVMAYKMNNNNVCYHQKRVSEWVSERVNWPSFLLRLLC